MGESPAKGRKNSQNFAEIMSFWSQSEQQPWPRPTATLLKFECFVFFFGVELTVIFVFNLLTWFCLPELVWLLKKEFIQLFYFWWGTFEIFLTYENNLVVSSSQLTPLEPSLKNKDTIPKLAKNIDVCNCIYIICNLQVNAAYCNLFVMVFTFYN